MSCTWGINHFNNGFSNIFICEKSEFDPLLHEDLESEKKSLQQKLRDWSEKIQHHFKTLDELENEFFQLQDSRDRGEEEFLDAWLEKEMEDSKFLFHRNIVFCGNVCSAFTGMGKCEK